MFNISETRGSIPRTAPPEYTRVTATRPQYNMELVESNTAWMPDPPLISNARVPRLERPVVIPRIDVANRLSTPLPFMRAYSPELRPHSVQKGDFVAFIDNLAVAQAPPAPLQALNVAGHVVGYVPHHWAMFAGAGMNVAAGVGTAAASYGRTRYFLEKANRGYFAPRGLHVSIYKYQQLAEKFGIGSHDAILGNKDVQAGNVSISDRCMSALQPYVASLSLDVPEPSGERNLLGRIAAKGVERKRRKQNKKLEDDSSSSSSSSSDSSSDEGEAQKKAARRLRKIDRQAKKDMKKHPNRAAEIEEDRMRKVHETRDKPVQKADKSTKRSTKKLEKDLEKMKRLEFIVVEALSERHLTTQT